MIKAEIVASGGSPSRYTKKSKLFKLSELSVKSSCQIFKMTNA